MKDNKRYEKLASLFDRSSRPDERERRPETPEDNELRKLSFLWDECHPEESGADNVVLKTLRKIEKKRKKAVMYKWIGSVAASLILAAGGLSFFLLQEGDSEVREMERCLQANNVSVDEVKEVTLVVSEKKKVEIANNSKVQYSTETNRIQINAENADEAAEAEQETAAAIAVEAEENNYNQLIVPKGRRSMIVLADGSRIWLNSGTKVVYPTSFNERKRRIFVEGEAYLQVAHDKEKPFVVSTSACDVEVLGTSFNVSAYKDAPETSVVLVEGEVDVRDRLARHVRMLPNDRVALNGTSDIQKAKVNVSDYIAWVDGVWILEGKPLKDVLQRLAEYYGKQIYCEPEMEEEPVYGKLYLNDELNKVLKAIQRSLSDASDTEKEFVYIHNEPEYKP